MSESPEGEYAPDSVRPEKKTPAFLQKRHENQPDLIKPLDEKASQTMFDSNKDSDTRPDNKMAQEGVPIADNVPVIAPSSYKFPEREEVDIHPNEFVVRDQNGDLITVRDLAKPSEQYTAEIARLTYEVTKKDTTKLGKPSNTISFIGKEENGEVRVIAERIGIGANKNTLRVIDKKEKVGWVMFEQVQSSFPGEGAGVTVSELSSRSMKIPLPDRTLIGAYRYMPLAEYDYFTPVSRDLEMAAENKHRLLGIAVKAVNHVGALLHPSTLLGEVQKYVLREDARRQGFDPSELHGGNIRLAYWNKRPDVEGLHALPTVRLDWKEMRGKHYMLPQMQWVTAELTEFPTR